MGLHELVRTIEDIGWDKYDKDRDQIFDAFYGKHNVDFFGTITQADVLNAEIVKMKREFGAKTKGDRGRVITPDIAIIYRADRCRMIEQVYENRATSDCFQFLTNPKDAFVKVRTI